MRRCDVFLLQGVDFFHDFLGQRVVYSIEPVEDILLGEGFVFVFLVRIGAEVPSVALPLQPECARFRLVAVVVGSNSLNGLELDVLLLLLVRQLDALQLQATRESHRVKVESGRCKQQLCSHIRKHARTARLLHFVHGRCRRAGRIQRARRKLGR